MDVSFEIQLLWLSAARTSCQLISVSQYPPWISMYLIMRDSFKWYIYVQDIPTWLEIRNPFKTRQLSIVKRERFAKLSTHQGGNEVRLSGVHLLISNKGNTNMMVDFYCMLLCNISEIMCTKLSKMLTSVCCTILCMYFVDVVLFVHDIYFSFNFIFHVDGTYLGCINDGVAVCFQDNLLFPSEITNLVEQVRTHFHQILCGFN